VSHKSVIQLIEDTANSLGDNIQFGYGRRSDFNLQNSPFEPWVWLLPLTANPIYTNNNNTENYQKQWNVIILFARMDQTGSTEKESKQIMDVTDELADKFINRLNDWSYKKSDVVGAITIRNFSQTPFIKSDADIFTGWFVSFQMIVSDDFLYCTPENVVLYGNE
jgi:hypothetical protein